MSSRAEPSPAGRNLEHPREEEREVFIFPASFQQRRLWFLQRLQPESPTYNIPAAFRISGPLDVEVLERSFQEIVARHEALRTTFTIQEGEAVQVIAPAETFRIERIDLAADAAFSALADAERERELGRRVNAEGARPFHLDRGPLLRAVLVRLSDQDHVLSLCLHHIVADGWSLGILSKELEELYGAFSRAALPALLPLPLQYADYSQWQEQWMRGEVLAKQLAHWKSVLGDAGIPLQLPSDRPRPALQSFRGDWLDFELAPELTRELKALSRQEGVTPYMTLLAAFQALLFRYGSSGGATPGSSGFEDVRVGAPVANRGRPELEGIIGFFVNTLVLRTLVSGEMSFRDLLSSAKRASLDAQSNQEMPFEKLVEELHPRRDPGSNPMFQVFFSLQTPPLRLQLPGLTVRAIPVKNGTAKFDLFLELWEEAGGILGRVEYSTDLFEAETVERMMSSYRALLAGVAARPESRVEELPILEAAERRRILVELNSPALKLPGAGAPPGGVAARTAAGLVHSLFEAEARRAPGAPALLWKGRRTSYRELEVRANRIAREILARGGEPGGRAGILLPRGPDLIASILGILKAGLAYVPLDPAYPQERLRFMAADAGLSCVITHGDLPGSFSCPTLFLDEDRESVGRQDPSPLGPSDLRTAERSAPIGPDDLAYVLYTSGSTGKPKGVAMPHRPLWNLLEWQRAASRAGAGTRTLQFTTPSFDVSFQEILATLGTGGELVLIADETRRDPGALLRLLDEERVERIFLPFIALKHLAEASLERGLFPRALREVITAGEQLQATPAVTRFFEGLPGATLSNQYGPTEAHVVTEHLLRGSPADWPALPPIGKPIWSARIHIVDRRLEPVPVGVAGELCIGGPVLARGYLGRPELTAEKFIPDPFAGEGERDARLYRTGDLARYLPSGEIVYLGRADGQVKIRGHRIEPGEIESSLEAHESVSQAVVMAREGPGGEKRLVAYVVPRGGARPESASLREWLKRSLPEYMLPGVFLLLDALPRTPSGKVDRRALPDPDEVAGGAVAGATRSAAARGPLDEIETKLLEIWRDVLRVKDLWVEDDFFDHGGHSLLAVRLIDRVGEAFGRVLPLSTLFRAGTVAAFARLLRSGVEESDPATDCLVAVKPEGSRPPLFLIHSVGGDVFFCRTISPYLAPEQPLYGIRAREGSVTDAMAADLPAMAAHYVAQVRRFQPAGPYHLGGWSSGGVVAWEMAQQLRAAGERVAFLGILDSVPNSGGFHGDQLRLRTALRVARNVLAWIRYDLLESSPREMLGRIARHFQKQTRRLGGQAGPSERVGDVVDLAGIPTRIHGFMERHFQAVRRYRISPYPDRVTLLKAAASPLFSLVRAEPAWREIARDLEVRWVPGNHLTIVREPHVRELAVQIECALAEERERAERTLASQVSASPAAESRP